MQPIAKLVLVTTAALLLALAAPAWADEAGGGTVVSREAIEHHDRRAARMGTWLWGVGLLVSGLFVLVAYSTTPKPKDKVTKIVGTHPAGITVEESLEET